MIRALTALTLLLIGITSSQAYPPPTSNPPVVQQPFTMQTANAPVFMTGGTTQLFLLSVKANTSYIRIHRNSTMQVHSVKGAWGACIEEQYWTECAVSEGSGLTIAAAISPYPGNCAVPVRFFLTGVGVTSTHDFIYKQCARKTYIIPATAN